MNTVKVGDVFKTKQGECTVIEYNNAFNVTVEFNDKWMYQTSVEAVQLRKGSVKNVFFPSVSGIGYIGEGDFSCKNTYEYRLWLKLIKNHSKGVMILDSKWFDLQEFCLWCEKNKKDGWTLSMEILKSVRKEVNENTICFLPILIFGAISEPYKRDKELPIGVYLLKNKKGYCSKVRMYKRVKCLGSYNTPQEASDAYIKSKESYVKELALEYKYLLPIEVYDALMSWKVCD